MNYTNKKTAGCGPSGCPKSGIKIHDTPSANTNANANANYNRQQNGYNSNYNNNNNNNNNNNIMLKKSSVQAPVSFHQTTLSELDLNVDNYSLEDLYNLFNIPGGILNETNLKSAKQIVYKMHPDKCRLDQKYFLFFSKAYKCLFSIYEFQNKSDKKTEASLKNDFYEESLGYSNNILSNHFSNLSLH